MHKKDVLQKGRRRQNFHLLVLRQKGERAMNSMNFYGIEIEFWRNEDLLFTSINGYEKEHDEMPTDMERFLQSEVDHWIDTGER